jgi:hypothetical protein
MPTSSHVAQNFAALNLHNLFTWHYHFVYVQPKLCISACLSQSQLLDLCHFPLDMIKDVLEAHSSNCLNFFFLLYITASRMNHIGSTALR